MFKTGNSRIPYADYKNKTMSLQFDDKTYYDYYDVPEDTFRRFMASFNKERFFHEEIRGKFRYQRRP